MALTEFDVYLVIQHIVGRELALKKQSRDHVIFIRYDELVEHLKPRGTRDRRTIISHALEIIEQMNASQDLNSKIETDLTS